VSDLQIALGLVAAVVVVSGVAHRLRLPVPIVLVVAGLVLGVLPGFPRVQLEPEIVLLLILPPLLYAAALNTAYADFRANLRPIALNAVGLVLVTTLTVGAVTHLVAPDLPLPVALALGAIVAPPDAVAATAVGRRLALPRRILTVLEGESLLNDATALVAYRIAVGAAVTGVASWGDAAAEFVLAAAGGAAVGWALAVTIAAIRRRLDDPLVENSLSLLTPFAAYLPAERLHASGVLAVVVAGLYLGRRSPVLLSSGARLQVQALWSMITFLLEGVVFALIGLQLPTILTHLSGRSPLSLAGSAAAVTATVIVTRILWVFPAAYLPRRLSRRLRERDPSPPWQYQAVTGWAGMRGVVSLAAAFALPEQLPGRDLLLFVTFCVILATLVLQGLSLPWLIARLGLHEGGDATERAEREAAVADHHIARSALTELEHLAHDEPVPAAVADRLRDTLQERVRRAHAVLGGCPGEDEYPHLPPKSREAVAEVASAAELRRRLLAVERAELLRLYAAGDVTDEALRRIQQQLDLEEVGLLA
jgi:monovalent cation/hydrogen antiporter